MNLDWLIEHWTEIVAVAGAIVIIARIIVKLTPTPKDDAILAKVIEVLKTIGLSLADTPRKPPPAALILLLLLPLVAGCAQSARHDFITQAVTDSLVQQDALVTLGGEAAASAKAKADQDQTRLDKALMLDIEALAKQTFATDAERQAAILALVQKYRTSAVAVAEDIETAADRQRRVVELTDATKEALAGIAVIEARTWANFAAREDLVNKAVVGKLLDLLKGKP